MWRKIFLLVCWSSVVSAKTEPLRIYTYESLIGKDSFGELVQREFSKRAGAEIQFVSFTSAGEALNQVLLERPHIKADIVMGIDQVLFLRAREYDLFDSVENKILKRVETSLKDPQLNGFVPFDFGYLAFVYDSLRTSPPPKATLGEFPGMLGNQKVVIQDPRTSTLGIELLIWTGSKLEEQFETFWKGLAPRILTISPGWSGAYELFLKRQVDYVLSYTTSPAYHRIRENKENIKALLFADGHFRQVEGLAVLKSSNQKVLAKKFIELVLEKEIQESIPTLQWMYPARSGANLPKEFRDIPVPTKVSMDWNKITAHRDEWTKLWTLILSREKK